MSSTRTEPALDERAAIVVAGGLAVRQWEIHLGAEPIAAGRRAWLTPPLVAYGDWIERLWQYSPEPRALPLRPTQTLALWRRVVADSPEGADLLGERGAARWAAEAWELCCDANIDLDREHAGPSQRDYRAFLAWHRRYADELDGQGWIDRPSIGRRLPDLEWRTPERVILADIDEPTPRQRALLERLERSGGCVERWSAPRTTAARFRVRLADARDELRTAVAWARARLAAMPDARIALVVPALDERRAELERALEEPFGRGTAGRAAVPLWYGGRALAESPRLGAALEALALGTESATFETLSRWLRSSFFGSANERSALAAFERELRRDVRSQLPFTTAYHETELPTLLQRVAPAAARALAGALAEIHAFERATPSRWAFACQRALTRLEWSGANDPDDALRWQGALDDFARLTPIVGELDCGSALAELGRALEAPAPEPLPVRGIHVLERVADVGPGYQAVWLTGFTDQAWPEPARGNPLLPRALQRKHEMPWSTPQDARARSARTLERLSRRVATLVASWPARVYDYDAEPSPALRDWRELDAAEIPVAEPHRVARARETRVDPAPAVAGTELRGGAGVLNRQARCPLRAFCEFRLDARALERPSVGVTGRLRGMATHRALELLFADLPARDDLARKHAEVRALAERALGELFRDARAPLRALFALEAERLATGLTKLVALEQSRAPFRVVALERRERIEVAGFALTVRIDRLDELSSGGVAIIDYKTGVRVTSADWFRERPRDVQVPLYAAHAAEHANAAVIAAVAPGAAGYRGYWTAGSFPGRPAQLGERDWPAQLARWRAQIVELVREYTAGDARLFVAEREEAGGPYASLTRLDEQLALARGSVERW